MPRTYCTGLCFAEPCLVIEENAGDHNLEMKWRLEGDMYFLHGDIIEVMCKPGYVLPPSVKESQLLVQCHDGELEYPTCISKGKVCQGFLLDILYLEVGLAFIRATSNLTF